MDGVQRQAFQMFKEPSLMMTDNTPLDLRQNELPPLRRGTVCYLVGAGLSAESLYQVPTAVGFFSRTFEKHYADQVKQINVPGLAPDLGDLLDRIEKDYGPLEKLNLETVMTDLYVRAFGIARSWEGYDYVAPLSRAIPDLRRDYGLLLHYVNERLPWLDRSSKLCQKLKAFVELLRREDSVVTLNYDTTLERHLCEREFPSGNHLRYLKSSVTPPGSTAGGAPPPMFRSAKPTGERGVFTKLHGSKDWFTCANELCPNSRYIQPMGSWERLRGVQQETAPGVPRCTRCGSSRRRVIVPPTAAKPFEEFPKLGVMWAQSYEAFRRARRWVFVGVSLAAADFHLSSFLRSLTRGHRGKMVGRDDYCHVCVVNPDSGDVAQRFVDSLGPYPAQEFRAGRRAIYVFDSVEKFLTKARASDQREASNEGPPH